MVAGSCSVMPALGAGIHILKAGKRPKRGWPAKPGHDAECLDMKRAAIEWPRLPALPEDQ
jgi:hypothetical protein